MGHKAVVVACPLESTALSCLSLCFVLNCVV